MKPDLKVYPDLDSLSKAAAKRIQQYTKKEVQKRGRFTLALSGGETPKSLYSLLRSEYKKSIPWEGVHLFWGDERFFPKEHPQSNYGNAYQTFISNIFIPSDNVHAVPTQTGDPEKAAESYEKHIRSFFEEPAGFPVFDLILLGIGVDGHTASLFPGDPILKEKNRLIQSVRAPPIYQTTDRITFSLPLINNAKNVFFIVSGSDKKEIISETINSPSTAVKKYPAALVKPKGNLVWYLDKEAASII